MSTALSAARILLAKALGDYFAGTTTSAGDSTSLIDTTLKQYQNDWITDWTWDLITSTTCLDEERRISLLDNATGDCTLVTAHSGTGPGSGATYEIHRLFTASDKRLALIHAAKHGFPFIHKQVRDQSLTIGNWLRDGDLEYNWTTSTANTYWKASALTMTKNTTAPYYKRGSVSCALSGATGYLYQSNTENPDLMDLASKSITFKAKVWCDTANAVRLGILYDGTNIEYSSYHAGDSEWATLSVSRTIDATPSAVSFRVYYTTGATAYVDDLRAYGPTRDKLYISDLGLAQDYPHQVLQSDDSSINEEPWQPLRNYTIGSDGYIYLPEGSQDYRLRVLGIGYLDFYDTAGAVGTDWADTIAIDSPQTEILIAEAAIYLCNQMIVPNFTSGESQKWERALAYWKMELSERQRRFGMKVPEITVHWGIDTGLGYKSRYGRTQ